VLPVMVKGEDWAFGGHLVMRLRRSFRAAPPPGSSPRWCSQTQGHLDDYVDAVAWLGLSGEAVEFPISDASEKSTPLVRREPEDRSCRVPAVANADLAIWQARHLDAIAVGVTQRALNPVKA
jgi:hypothetical protein